jgi:hypothetical protein
VSVLEVGGPYHPNRTTWKETPVLRLGIEGVELALFFDRPTPAEITAVTHGLDQWGWIDEGGPVGVMCFRFGQGPWADTPYNPHREDPALTPGVAATAPGQHLLITVVLVDASTGIVRALRQVTWPHAFAEAVGASVRRMLAAPADQPAADRALAELYATGTDTLAVRAGARCAGGYA